MCQLVARMPQLKWLVLPVKHVHNTITNFTVKSTSWVLDKQTPKFSTSFGLTFHLSTHLHWLLVELKFIHKSTNIFHRLAIQRKSTQVNTSWSQSSLSMKFITFCYLCDKPTYKSVWLPIASPYMQVSWFCKLVSTCIDLRVCLSELYIGLSIHTWGARSSCKPQQQESFH